MRQGLGARSSRGRSVSTTSFRSGHSLPIGRQRRGRFSSQSAVPPETRNFSLIIYGARIFRRRASSAASANSQFRNVAIFGTLEVTFGQTIQYVLDILKETSIGLTRRPLMISQAASAVRASATP